MAVLPIRKHGDPLLTGGVSPVEKITDEIRKLIDDMIDTMSDAEAVGVSAPQVGVALAIIVARPPPDSVEHEGPIVLLNPEIVFTDGAEVIEEGCLSCPGITAEIERPSHLVVTGLDAGGARVKLEVKGALARIFQHEIDHLEGRFFIDHLHPIRRQLLKARIRRT